MYYIIKWLSVRNDQMVEVFKSNAGRKIYIALGDFNICGGTPATYETVNGAQLTEICYKSNAQFH